MMQHVRRMACALTPPSCLWQVPGAYGARAPYVKESARDLGVDPSRRLLQRAAYTACAHGQDLRQDRQGRLRRAVGADVETRRAGDPVDRLFRHARLEQPLAPPRLVAARAERAHVEGLARK